MIVAVITSVTCVLNNTNRGSSLAAVNFSLKELPACSGNVTLFPRGDKFVPEGKTVVDFWKEEYHGTVRTIVEEHVQSVEGGGTCDGTRDSPASAALKRLSERLGMENIHQKDVGRVLQKYLREYECALQSQFFIRQQQAEVNIGKQQLAKGDTGGTPIEKIAEVSDGEGVLIEQELALSRGAHHRILVYFVGYGRLEPISHALQCLVGATLDIWNNLNLMREASACLPRIWDARTSVRTLTPL